MTTINENTWGDDVDNTRSQGSGSTSFGVPDNGNIANSYPDDTEDDLDTDDETLDTDDDLIDTDDDLADTDGDDLADTDGDYEEAKLDDTEGGGNVTSGNYSGSGYTNNPDETPEEHESDDEGTGYGAQTEVEQQQGGADTSYSEQNDVTPPNAHGFPSVGAATKTDFVSRPQGRTTGRMIGHEPGTEGI